MALSGSLPQINLKVRPRMVSTVAPNVQIPSLESDLIFEIIPEQYFSGVENVEEFLENIDNNLTYYEIPHLTGQALDWFDILGYRVVEDKATDYAHLKQALNWQENWRETRGNNRYVDNSRPRREFNRFESLDVVDNRRFDGRHRGGQTGQRFHNQSGRQGGSRNSAFRENPPDSEHRTIRISSLRMTPVDLPYVPMLLNETFITALWDTGAEKSFISQEVYRKYFSYRSRQKTNDRVVTAQGAPCCHLGLFSDQPGLTHVLYHEIDTGDKRPVVPRPYRYDRVKQGIIDYHIEKMLREVTIRPIQSPYASPVVLTRKNNDLPPDFPEAYRFAIDYCKLNTIL
ncbi:uncharacterized protein TNCV_4341291 [Trichonephila clavipes]|nr:uncharacterized protein TNCV_4341291 [Trichonephila clavipes]